MEMGERIRQRRLELGLTQEELGKKCDVNRQAVYLWEQNKTEKLKRPTISAIARALQTNEAWLLGLNPTVENSDLDIVDTYSRLNKESKSVLAKLVNLFSEEQLEGFKPDIDTLLLYIDAEEAQYKKNLVKKRINSKN